MISTSNRLTYRLQQLCRSALPRLIVKTCKAPSRSPLRQCPFLIMAAMATLVTQGLEKNMRRIWQNRRFHRLCDYYVLYIYIYIYRYYYNFSLVLWCPLSQTVSCTWVTERSKRTLTNIGRMQNTAELHWSMTFRSR